MALPQPEIADFPRRSQTPAILALSLTLPAVFLISLAAGSVSIPTSEIARILVGGTSGNSAWDQIVLNLRIPRALTAVCAGAALALSGLQMQTLFRTPLAGPFVLGI